MENPNIHNIPYVRSRDQKRWKDHAKKVASKEEITQRMRKWRAENKDKNKKNDLRCRVYRLARQKFGDQDSPQKQAYIRYEIDRRLGQGGNIDLVELPFYNAPQQKLVLPTPNNCRFPPIHTMTPYESNTSSTFGKVKYVEQTKILDEFVGLILDFADDC
ncbi:hypothetical protein DFQ28_008883 [Apophysomyces sp. BC1034]|nr:hypothetical protein DFQ30_005231 [Apophysomyces sp. BC1015]KAG0183394.1 hypothetical protein DFQ29_005770 [Apophysomyces sp. BC1021]KAG0194624.1 hypothetical protein DFQ28_008883 [Apophysomyces sp. BC1034]